MKNILVPTDFSGNATHAIRFALELSRKQKSKITLFHSFVLPVYATDIPVFPQADEELRKVSEEALSNLVSKTGDGFSVSASDIVNLGRTLTLNLPFLLVAITG